MILFQALFHGQSDLSFSFNKLKIIQTSGNSSLFLHINTNNEGKKIRNGKSTTVIIIWLILSCFSSSSGDFLCIFIGTMKINHIFHATFSFSQLDVLLHSLTRCTRQPFVSLPMCEASTDSLSHVANTHFLYALMWHSKAQSKTLCVQGSENVLVLEMKSNDVEMESKNHSKFRERCCFQLDNGLKLSMLLTHRGAVLYVTITVNFKT